MNILKITFWKQRNKSDYIFGPEQGNMDDGLHLHPTPPHPPQPTSPHPTPSSPRESLNLGHLILILLRVALVQRLFSYNECKKQETRNCVCETLGPQPYACL